MEYTALEMFVVSRELLTIFCDSNHHNNYSEFGKGWVNGIQPWKCSYEVEIFLLFF